MKWIEKELVPGTRPAIRIGRRVFKSTDGTEKATETFWATFSIGGKQRFVSLDVFKRDDAFRAAHRLSQRLETGEHQMTERTNIKLGEIIDAYRSTSVDGAAKFLLGDFDSFGSFLANQMGGPQEQVEEVHGK